MPRRRRTILSNAPHHVTDRGNGRQPIFCFDEDCATYIHLLEVQAIKNDVFILQYELMQNHVHLILQPADNGLSTMMRELKAMYARYFHATRGGSGHLFGERFFCDPIIDDEHLFSVVRYVALNPCTAGLVRHPMESQWSSYRSTVLGFEGPNGGFRKLLQYFDDDNFRAIAKLRRLVEGDREVPGE